MPSQLPSPPFARSHAIAMAPSSSRSRSRFVSPFISNPHILLQWMRKHIHEDPTDTSRHIRFDDDLKKAPVEGIGDHDDALVFILWGVKGKEHALPRKYLHFSVNRRGDVENKLDINSPVRNTEKNGMDPATRHAHETSSNGSDSTNGDTVNINGYETASRPSSISIDNSHRPSSVDVWDQWSRSITPSL